MGASRLAERLERCTRLSDAERSALEALENQERVCRRGTVLIEENSRARELFIVREGWLHSSVHLGDGSRQIMRFHLPGDIVGMPLLAFPLSPETVTAVTDVRIAPVTRERLAQLMTGHERLGSLILSLSIAERVGIADRLASIGRTPARARIASLLCELFGRVRLGDCADGDMLQIPLTQEDIGDATGLTAVHVNRMIRRLVEDGIIARNGNQVRLLDKPRLREEASFLERPPLAFDWLPSEPA